MKLIDTDNQRGFELTEREEKKLRSAIADGSARIQAQ